MVLIEEVEVFKIYIYIESPGFVTWPNWRWTGAIAELSSGV